MEWVRLYHDMPTLSDDGRTLADALFYCAKEQRTHHPDWRTVEIKSGLRLKRYLEAFEELEACGIVSPTFPSVITVLEGYDWSKEWVGRMPWPKWKKTRARIFARDNHACTYCGASECPLECDHVLPLSRGGDNRDENLTTSCVPCNRSKRDKTNEEWRAA